jgi:O-antigen ligase
MIVAVVMTGRMIRWNLQTIAVAVFAGVATLSAVNAWQPDFSWRWLYQYITVVVAYYLILAVCRAPRDLFLLVMTYIGTMFLYLSKSLWEYFIHGRHEYAQSVPRLLGIESTYGEPNSVAMSVVLSLPFWLLLFRCRKALTWQWGRIWVCLYDGLIFVYPVLALVAVWLTNSRAGMLGVGGFVMGALVLRSGSGSLLRVIVGCGVLLGALWIVTPAQQKDRLRTLWDPDAAPANAQASASGRWEGFQASMQMLNDRPLWGVGIGNFLEYRVAFVDGVGLVSHNLPGQILGEMGLLGGFSFALMVWATWSNACRLKRLCRGQTGPAFYLYREVALACILGVLLLLLFGASLHNGLRYNWLWIAAFCGLGLEFCQQTWADQEQGEVDSIQ